jgi:hypothetical protein
MKAQQKIREQEWRKRYDLFLRRYRSARKSRRPALLIEGIELILDAFRSNDMFYPAHVGDRLEEILRIDDPALPSDDVIDKVSNIAWNIQEGDSWQVYYWEIGSLEAIVRYWNWRNDWKFARNPDRSDWGY